MSAAGHTSDAHKVDVVRRVIVGATESGAQRIVLADDPQGIARRAASRIDAPLEFLSEARTGTRMDSIRAASSMRDKDVGVVVAIGGDGTCRDVAAGWSEAPLIALSTGTNNVFPVDVDATAAGTVAAMIAGGRLDLMDLSRPAKRLALTVEDPLSDGGPADDLALVEVALIDGDFVGARAVHDPSSIRVVVAAIAQPESTGLSSIAGRLRPLSREEPGAVVVRLGGNSGYVRVSLTPGASSLLPVQNVSDLASNETVVFNGPGVVACDGERYRTLSNKGRLHVTVHSDGPRVIDVTAAMKVAFDRGEFFSTTKCTTNKSKVS